MAAGRPEIADKSRYGEGQFAARRDYVTSRIARLRRVSADGSRRIDPAADAVVWTASRQRRDQCPADVWFRRCYLAADRPHRRPLSLPLHNLTATVKMPGWFVQATGESLDGELTRAECREICYLLTLSRD